MAPSVWLAEEQMGGPPSPCPSGPRGRCTHTYAHLHVYQRVDTHGYTPPPSPALGAALVLRVLGFQGEEGLRPTGVLTWDRV